MPCSPAGLAEDWNPDDNVIFTKSSFSQNGNFPPVEDNVFLVKGLYSDSLPPFLQQQKAWASGFRQRGSYRPAPLTYLHIDCGACPGSLEALTAIRHHLQDGRVLQCVLLWALQRSWCHQLPAWHVAMLKLVHNCSWTVLLKADCPDPD